MIEKGERKKGVSERNGHKKGKAEMKQTWGAKSQTGQMIGKKIKGIEEGMK